MTGQPGQDNQDKTGSNMTGRTRPQNRIDRQNRTGKRGQTEQDRQNVTGRTGQAEQEQNRQSE
jgi:hypothetical protein